MVEGGEKVEKRVYVGTRRGCRTGQWKADCQEWFVPLHQSDARVEGDGVLSNAYIRSDLGQQALWGYCHAQRQDTEQNCAMTGWNNNISIESKYFKVK